VAEQSRFAKAFTTTTVVPELDLTEGIGQRSSTFRFDLVNGVTGQLVRTLKPISGVAPTLSHDTTRTIKRQLSNLNLGVDDTAAVNPLTDRLALYMIVDGVEYPLGRYVFTDFSRFKRLNGDLSNAVLMDEMWIVDQQIEMAFTAKLRFISSTLTALAEDVVPALTRLLVNLPITFTIEDSPFITSGSWSIGTNRGSIVESIALDGDYFSPWFDNNHVMRFIRSFDPATVPPTFNFDEGQSVMADNIVGSDDILNAPNRYIVVSNATGDTTASQIPIVGIYDVPSSAPYSNTNRGFVIPVIISLPVQNNAQASALAANLGQRNTIFERMSINTAIDPRHDSYDVIRWQGENWLELGWTFTCVEGSLMRHTLRKTYS
jgi:hypothetical protein